MQVLSVKNYGCKSLKAPGFKSNREECDFDIPINQDTEKKLAILSSLGLSTVAGLVAAGLTSCAQNTTHSKRPMYFGLGAAITTFILTIFPRVYEK